MSDKLDRFTLHTRNVLLLTKTLARRFHHESIDPEHLLLALMHTTNDPAVEVLRGLGIEPGQVIYAIELAYRPGCGLWSSNSRTAYKAGD
jgi:ATP-dependent Clp protease ATP-binding subunit ClpA